MKKFKTLQKAQEEQIKHSHLKIWDTGINKKFRFFVASELEWLNSNQLLRSTEIKRKD